MKISEGARKVIQVCAGVKPDEKVLIVTDTERPFVIAKELAKAAEFSGAVCSIIISSSELVNGEPNDMVTKAISSADVVLAVTTRTLGHTMAVAEALKNGTRVIAMTECTEQILSVGSIEADFFALKDRVNYVEKRFNQAKEVHVTAPGGTDLWLDISGRKAAICSGFCNQPGTMIGIPGVEVYIAPIEEHTEGVLVADASGSIIGLIEHPVTIEIEKGKAISITGEDEAERLKSLLASTNTDSSYIIAEFAIGLNPEGNVIGNIANDEGIYGTGHFALGNNTGFGGKNKAPLHIDMVYRKPTIYLDGDLFMKDGLLIV